MTSVSIVRSQINFKPFGGQHGVGPVSGNTVYDEIGELYSAVRGDVRRVLRGSEKRFFF
jgi:hypothetical protein